MIVVVSEGVGGGGHVVACVCFAEAPMSAFLVVRSTAAVFL